MVGMFELDDGVCVLGVDFLDLFDGWVIVIVFVVFEEMEKGIVGVGLGW